MNATITMSISGDAPPARRIEEHDEVSVDVTGSAVASDAEAADYAEGNGSESHDEERTPETSAVNSGSDEG